MSCCNHHSLAVKMTKLIAIIIIALNLLFEISVLADDGKTPSTECTDMFNKPVASSDGSRGNGGGPPGNYTPSGGNLTQMEIDIIRANIAGAIKKLDELRRRLQEKKPNAPEVKIDFVEVDKSVKVLFDGLSCPDKLVQLLCAAAIMDLGPECKAAVQRLAGPYLTNKSRPIRYAVALAIIRTDPKGENKMLREKAIGAFASNATDLGFEQYGPKAGQQLAIKFVKAMSKCHDAGIIGEKESEEVFSKKGILADGFVLRTLEKR